MKQTYISLATKINDDATMYELLIASYVVSSKLQENLPAESYLLPYILQARIRNFKCSKSFSRAERKFQMLKYVRSSN